MMKANDKAKGQIFILIGPDTFLLKEQVNKWKQMAEMKYSEFNILFTSLEIPSKNAYEHINKKTKELTAELITPSFFGGKRVIFLENFPPSEKIPEGADKFLQRVINTLQALPEGNVVIVHTRNPDRRTKIWKQLEKLTNVEKFDFLRDQALYDWIMSSVSKYQGKILPAAAKYLAEYCGHDLWKLDNEIQKLVNYCEQKPIAEKDIETICVRHFAEAENFAIAKSLQSGNLKTAIKTFHNELNNGKAPQLLLFRDLSSIMRQIINVSWAIDNNLNANNIGLNPFIFSTWKGSRNKISFEKAKDLYLKLLMIDHDSKSGKIDISAGDQRLFCLRLEEFLIEFFKKST